jgi:hypothetical protein
MLNPQFQLLIHSTCNTLDPKNHSHMMQLSVHHNPLLDKVPTKLLAHIGYFTSIYMLLFLGYL